MGATAAPSTTAPDPRELVVAIVDLHHDITALEAELADLERSLAGGLAALERPADPAFAARTTALAERATQQLMVVGRAEIDRQLDAVREEASARVRRARAAAEAEVDAARARLADALRARAATVDTALTTTIDPVGVARVHVLAPPLPRLDRLEVAARLSEVARESSPETDPVATPVHALADLPDQHDLLAALVADVDPRTTAPLGTTVEEAHAPAMPVATPVQPSPAPVTPAIEPAEQPDEADPTDRLVALFAPAEEEEFAERRRFRAFDAILPLVLTLVVLVAVLLVVG